MYGLKEGYCSVKLLNNKPIRVRDRVKLSAACANADGLGRYPTRPKPTLASRLKSPLPLRFPSAASQPVGGAFGVAIGWRERSERSADKSAGSAGLPELNTRLTSFVLPSACASPRRYAFEPPRTSSGVAQLNCWCSQKVCPGACRRLRHLGGLGSQHRVGCAVA